MPELLNTMTITRLSLLNRATVLALKVSNSLWKRERIS
nr:MAG TPA: hypothetical protein [Bacteriophage sp.]